MDKKQVINRLKEYLTLLKNNNININKAYLFGSYHFDKANDLSDIDIAIISKDFGENYFQEALFLTKLARNIDINISPMPYSLEEYEKAKPGDFLWQEIINKGQLIEV